MANAQRPVILTIDDEPQVLNAVERDLRSHFRSAYRIVKSTSGAEALEAVHQLKEREATIALFLADERMPGMSGTEFLAQAQAVYPDARKVLLTAYADTAAAISGINDVGLDYYLMKPWDPPEERLFPVLDDLLEDWVAGFRPPFQGIKVIGAAWSPASHDVKDFLSRNQIPYKWLNVDIDAEGPELMQRITGSKGALPLVVFPDRSFISDPSPQQLAEKIGLQTRASLPHYDLIVLGGGPAGLAGAVYGASEGLRTVLIESSVTGGQAGTSSRIENYLGFPSGVSGADLARRATTQAKRFGAEVVVPLDAASVRTQDPYRIVTLSDGTELSCHALLVATGMAVRRLDVPGIDQFTGVGVFYGAALSEASACRGHHVFVVGGANSAGQAAMLFSRYASKVTMLVRGASPTASMSTYLLDRIMAAENVEVLSRANVVEVRGDRSLEEVDVDVAGVRRTFQVQHLFIFIGATPRSECLASLVEIDQSGFIVTGTDLLRREGRPAGWHLDRDPFLLETSVPGIFAAGDVRRDSTKRVAAAVGEGSASVAMVHKYLGTV
jgi:thioredoxin reductase (NADPH)